MLTTAYYLGRIISLNTLEFSWEEVTTGTPPHVSAMKIVY